MVFQNPFASFGHSEEESFGDFEYLDHPEPSFVREDFDIQQFEQRRASNDTDRTAVVVPSLVTLARAYMWDRLPGGYSVYDDKQSSADLEACPSEKREWQPLNIADSSRRERSDSISSSYTEAPDLDEDDPRITGIPRNTDDIALWRKSFEEENGRVPSQKDEAEFLKSQCKFIPLLPTKYAYSPSFIVQLVVSNVIAYSGLAKRSFGLAPQLIASKVL